MSQTRLPAGTSTPISRKNLPPFRPNFTQSMGSFKSNNTNNNNSTTSSNMWLSAEQSLNVDERKGQQFISRKEFEALKNQNKALAARVDSVEAENSELKTSLQMVKQECKLHIERVESGARMRMNNMQDNHLKFGEDLVKLVTTKIVEVGDKLEKKQIEWQQGNQRKFHGQQVELEKLAKQGDDNSAELRAEMDALKSQAAYDRKKLEELQARVISLEMKLTFMWSTNQWDVSGQLHVRISADGLIATKTADNSDCANVRGQLAISRKTLPSVPGTPLVYFEVQVKNNLDVIRIGWDDAENPLDIWLGNHSDSRSLDWRGDYYESGHKHAGHGKESNDDDIVWGSGVLLTRNGRMKLFFTKSGRMNGKPIELPTSASQQQLFPAVSLRYKDTSVEANFGADLVNKPFLFNADAHKAKLFE